MSAATQNVTIEQFATYQLSLLWKDSNGNPVNLTGYRLHSQYRQHDTGLVVINMDSSNPVSGITISTLDSTGQFTVTVNPSITSGLVGMGIYDLVLIAPDGTIDRLLQGTWYVSQGVTNG